MTKFFREDTTEVQEIPLETMKELFPRFLEAPEEYQKAANKWIVIKSGTTPDGLTYQAVIQNIAALANFMYHIFVFKDDNTLLAHLPVRAVNPLPPVAEKYKGLDYFDWLEIQGVLIKFLADKGYKSITLDEDPEGKLVYTTKETPEEVVKKIQNEESYTILSMPAPAFLEKIKKMKEEKENAPRIITPDSPNFGVNHNE